MRRLIIILAVLSLTSCSAIINLTPSQRRDLESKKVARMSMAPREKIIAEITTFTTMSITKQRNITIKK